MTAYRFDLYVGVNGGDDDDDDDDRDAKSNLNSTDTNLAPEN